MEEKYFEEYLNKRVCITLKKLKKHENPFFINKFEKFINDIESQEIEVLPRYIDDESINHYIQVKITGILKSIRKNDENVFSFSITPEEYPQIQHILLSCIPDFALFVDTTDILHKNIEYTRQVICRRLNNDVFSIIKSYLTHDYKQIIIS